ncbi:hypothetical protein [Gemmatimonas sp.]|uniref:hypothetical protein n=1 Tax=Gemmatimonas sp. TaxID=1962908 RepID=UPI0033407D06
MDVLYNDMKRDHLPILGVLGALVLFALATTRYPGGYDWTNNTISTLFQPRALNGAQNSARSIAVLAVFMFCASMAVVFKWISSSATSRFHKKTIEIGGIGSMVYGFLVVTPMHDLLVTVGLVFFLTAMLATLHMLYAEGRSGIFYAGIGCLALPLTNAAMYYANVLYGLLPIIQKLGMVMWVGWLFAVLRSRGQRR